MAVIQDLVLTFCPTMHSVQQKKLKLLMPEWETSMNSERVQNRSNFFPSFHLLWGMIVKKGILCRAIPFSGSPFLLHVKTIRRVRHPIKEESSFSLFMCSVCK